MGLVGHHYAKGILGCKCFWFGLIHEIARDSIVR